MKRILYIPSALIVVLLIFILPGQVSGPLKYDRDFPIDHNEHTAFRVMLNPFQFKNWIPGYRGIRPVSGRISTPGSVNHIFLERNGREIMVTQLIRKIKTDTVFSALYEWKSWELDHVIQILPATEGSVLHVQAAVKTSGILTTSLLFWGRKQIRNEIDQMFTDLQTVINRANPSPPFPLLSQ